MTEIITAILENASAVASLTSAFIAAAVTIIALLINQIFARRQQRQQFLQPKLEELYLLLNEVAERNTRLFKLIAAAAEGNLSAKKQLAALDDLEIYGHLTAKKMVMLVRLYFPKLSRIHQCLFAAEREVNQCIWFLSTGTEVNMEQVIESSGQVSHMIRLMEQEMVNNQDVLLMSTVLPRRFKPVSEEEIKNVPPPPSGKPLSG